MLISNIIESFMPIPMPASVIGLVLLFIALCTGFFAQMLITKSFIPRKRPQKQLAEDKL